MLLVEVAKEAIVEKRLIRWRNSVCNEGKFRTIGERADGRTPQEIFRPTSREEERGLHDHNETTRRWCGKDTPTIQLGDEISNNSLFCPIPSVSLEELALPHITRYELFRLRCHGRCHFAAIFCTLLNAG